MYDKFTTNVAESQDLIHKLPAGLMKGDKSTELFGCRVQKRVFAVSNGYTVSFQELDYNYRLKIHRLLLKDEKAMSDLAHLSLEEKIERFAYCVFGACDHEPDFDSAGNLNSPDNFICSLPGCSCLSWDSKKITVDGKELTPRQIEVVQLMASDLPDKQIAYNLGISNSTLDSHKHNIFEKFDVKSKSGLVRKAIHQKIIQ